MPSCLPELPPTNPISALILGVLGDNFFPPYDANFQPTDRGQLTEEKFLKMNTPGGGKLKPIGDPKHVHLSEYIAPISGVLGSVFAFFAPLYIILDLIRAIIDTICALFNPVPVIVSLIDLFINVVPPVIALYPPLSSILHAINVAKLVTAIVGSIVSALIPIINEVVECALAVPAELAAGNIAILDTIEVKICELLQDFTNALGGFQPISFILDLLETFLNLGAKFFCAQDAACCNAENCPPIIINPPAGEMEVLNTIYRFSLRDLLVFIADLVNPVLEVVSGVINDFLTAVFDTINGIFNSVRGTIDGIIDTVEDFVQVSLDATIGAIIDAINFLSLGLLDLEAPTIELPEIPNLPDLPGPPIVDLTIQIPDIFDDIVLIQPLMTLEYKTAISQPNQNGLISQVGVGHEFTDDELAGLQSYIIPPDLLPVPLPKLPSFLGGSDDEEDDDPSTIKLEMTSSSGQDVIVAVTDEPQSITTSVTIALDNDRIVDSTTGETPTSGGLTITKPDGTAHPAFVTEVPIAVGPAAIGEYSVSYETGGIVIFNIVEDLPLNRDFLVDYSYLDNTSTKTATAPAVFEFPTPTTILQALGLEALDELVDTLVTFGFGFLPVDEPLGVIQVKDDSFPAGTRIDYRLIPDEIELIKQNLIGLGCQSDIQSATQGLTALINADVGAAFPGTDGLSPLRDKIQQDFPPPPVECFQEVLDQLTADPTTYVDPVKCMTDYFDELAEFVDEVLCVGASRANSTFTVNKRFVEVGERDRAILTFQVKDAGGNNLLENGSVPGSQFRVQFNSTIGKVGPVEFDPDTGTFTAPLTSEVQTGVAQVTAQFIVREKPCMTAGVFENLEVVDNVQEVEFVSRGTFPRVRRKPEYVQSRGGRSRR